MVFGCSDKDSSLKMTTEPEYFKVLKTESSFDCKTYNFVNEDPTTISSPFDDLIFYNNYNYDQLFSWWYGATCIDRDYLKFVLPLKAKSISVDLLSKLNEIGSIIKCYDENMQLIYETIPEDTDGFWADPVHVEIIPPNDNLISYIYFYPKFEANHRCQTITKMEICYIPECNVPSVNLNASISEIWPPNGKNVNVIFSGSILNDCNGGFYSLTDEYGEINYSDILPAGDFNVSLNLIASRKGNDKDGRKYTFTVSSSNSSGSVVKVVDVIVPHDKRK